MGHDDDPDSRQREPYDHRRALELLAADFRKLVDIVAQMTGVFVGAEGSATRARRAAMANQLAEQAIRIVGGYPTSEFSECCCIGGVDGAGAYFCTGTLIAPNAVLTAACGTEPRMQRVLFGARLDDPNARVIAVKQVIPHVHREPAPAAASDLCLLILEQDAPVAPAAIATGPELAAAHEVHLVGFGCDDPLRPHGFGIKRHANVDISLLQRTPDDDLSQAERQLGFHAEHEFVAGCKYLGRDACDGDRGGPAYIYVRNRFTLAGITSRPTRGGGRCGGGVYVRPDRFIDWIRGALTAANAKTAPAPR